MRFLYHSFILAGLLLAGPQLLSAQVEAPLPEHPEPAAVLLRAGTQLNFHFLPQGTPQPPPTDEPDPAEIHTSVHHLRGERGAAGHYDLYLQVVPPGAPESVPPPRSGIGFVDSLAATYQIIATGKPVDEHLLQPGAVLGLHDINLRLDAHQQEFEEFIHKMWSPTRSDALPYSKLIFLKALSGPRSGEFSYMWVIESEDARDYYFPESGKPSKMYRDFEKGWAWIEDEEHLGKYVDPDTEDVFTDYIVIR